METWHKSTVCRRATGDQLEMSEPMSWAISALLIFGLSAAVAPTAHAQSEIPVPDSVRLATVQGTVFDSIAQKPLTGAQIQFTDEATKQRLYATVADSVGHYSIDSLPPGKYIAGFFHSAVDLLGIEAPLRLVTLAAGRGNVVNLGIPDASRMISALCGPRSRKDTTGAMAGVVRDADSGLPLADARVSASWLEIRINRDKLVSVPRQLVAQTDADGGFRMCGLPGADTLFVSASNNGIMSGILRVPVPPRGIARQDFALGDSITVRSLVPDTTVSAELRAETAVLRGSATLSGIVLGADDAPLEDAQIVVRGTGLDVKSDKSGRFVIAGLPAGTFSVDARAIGKEPVVIPVALSSRKPTTMEIRLTRPIQNLSRVLVFGQAPKVRQDLLDFDFRRKSGMGHYYTQEDPNLKHAVEVSNVLTMVPGVRILSSGRFSHTVSMHRGCPAWIYLDGIKMDPRVEDIDDIPPNQIAGLEVYTGSLEAPAKFPTPIGCGIVLIWLKH
jgi:hypothetical protein